MRIQVHPLTGLIGPLLLASMACQAPQPAAGPAASAPGAAAGGEPAVRRVVMATAPTTTESNHSRFIGPFESIQVRPMYEFLIGHDQATGKLVPQLATEWKLEPDGASFRFKLKQGVPFQKGHGDFTAQDVVFTYEDLTAPDSTHTFAGYWRTTVKGIDVVSPQELVFRLEPNGNFVPGVSEQEWGMEIRSKAHFQKAGAPTMQTEPTVGTGPYQFKERAQGQYIRYERVPGSHWRVQADFPEYEFRPVREASTRLAGLLAGEIHVTQLPRDLQQQAERGGMRVVNGRLPGSRLFLVPWGPYIKDIEKNEGWQYPDSPLLDVRVRKALQHAVNLNELNKSFFGGKAEIMQSPVMHSSWAGFDPAWDRNFQSEYGFDPARARALLAEAGYTAARPLETNLHLVELSQYPGTADLVEAVGAAWTAVGVKVNLVQMDSAQRAAGTREARFSNDWIVDSSTTPEWDFVRSRLYSMAAARPPRGGKDHETDKLFREVQGIIDPVREQAGYRAISDVVYRKHLFLNLLWLPTEAVVNPKVVSDYVFSGISYGVWTHPWNIKAAR